MFPSHDPGVDLILKEDGKAGVEYLEKERPNFIILDLNLPNMTGKEVLTYIKTHPELKSIPVIVYTTSQEQIDIEDVYDMGGAAYLTKPYGYNDALEKIKFLGDFWIGVVEWPN